MLSSSSSSGGGGDGGGFGGAGGGGGAGRWGIGSSGGNGNSSGVWSSGKKKQQKLPKIPKRGPGVAELEKILRDNEKSEGGININNINTTSSNNNNNVEGFSVSHPYSDPRRRTPPPLALPPPPMSGVVTSRPPPTFPPPSHHIPIAPRFDHLSPRPRPRPGLYGYNTAKQEEGRNFPEQPLFPMNPSSCDGLLQPDNHHHHRHHTANSSSSNKIYSESSSNPSHHHLWSSIPALPQERHRTNQYSSSMVKQILGPRAPPPSSNSLTTGHFNHEPPSSQNPYFNARNPTEEPKMVGMMRPHPSSSFENSLVPSTNFQVSPFFPNLITRPHNKSSSNNDTHFDTSNFTSSNNDCFRDVEWGGTLGLNSNRSRFSSDIIKGVSSNFSSLINGTAAASIPTPPVPSPSMPMFQRELSNNNNHQVPEDKMEDSNQKSESSRGGSDQERPFYNFLKVEEEGDMEETIPGSNHEGSEVGTDGPDLTLKL
ncbi:hypothetical protein K1719_026018 [Acacia pycnantha]|nr:hypothetical protein K1719_026018 [Acacia pycnantha]